MPRKKKAIAKKLSHKKATKRSTPVTENHTIFREADHRATTRLAQIWFITLFMGTLALVIWMAWDFQGSIIFGLIIAGAFYPLVSYCIQKLGWSRRLAAFATTIVILLAVILPAIFIAVRLVQEARVASELITAWLSEENIQQTLFGNNYISRAGKEIFKFFNEPYTLENVKNLTINTATSVSKTAIEWLSGLAGGTLEFFFQFFLMMLVIHTIFINGPALKDFILRLSPLPREDEELIIDRFNQMNFVTLVCNGIGGVLQGGMAGIGFWIAGIPSSLLWTVLMVILAFIPLVGMSIVYVPACIYLLITGHYWIAAILFAYCTIVSLLTENWFKPIFMGNRIRINSMLIFFSIIGGMSLFGMAGIFYGPLIIIIFLTFVQLYLEKYEENLNN